jgi:peptidoglycan-N-acetylglucosamine deacetylase
MRAKSPRRNTSMTRYCCPETPFSAAEKIGFGAFALAMVLFPLEAHLAVFPLSGFLLLCLIAPFIPRLRFFLPVISRGRRDTRAVALTFDDGPDPVSTPKLLDLLDRHRALATFFVTGKRAVRYPGIIEIILSRGHTIGNHTHGHDNFIMLKSSRALKAEIMEAQMVLKDFGIVPLVFRPPVGVTSPRLSPVLRDTGMIAVNFSKRAADRGNRDINGISTRILSGLAAGDIIMLHDTRPHHAAFTSRWLGEIDRVLSGIREKGLEIIPLSVLIDHPVMVRVKKK